MRLTEQAHALIRPHLRPGDTVIDATVGNGYDTLFLAEGVGGDGNVYGFDIQLDALKAAGQLLEEAGYQNVRLYQSSHSRLRSELPPDLDGRISVVMFNLGYLPGGDHGIVTTRDSTLPAISQSFQLLKPAGLLSVIAYTGHSGGREETIALEEHFASMDLDSVQKLAWPLHPATVETGPRLYVIQQR
ncbi:class I SAM-dependent methyltransferase [Stratiformator vulcanicus]|uniref:Arsenite S-adenosylmethyltransferase n=1 Tax=Stratiformator vulcanicus TaxID=2527980 RepID=A0A517QVL0_9PLAN|nr:class I SAM-dependent methyltransferase [Stratiformator vulcanicus]QDT35653.1 arsenite S-adenosylmethyltransferase [Stratiformator vulcanicus]